MFELIDVLRRLLRITKATDNEQRQRAHERVDSERTTMSLADDVPTGRVGIYIPSEQRMATIDTLFPYELAPGILTPPAPRRRQSSTNYGQLRRWAPTPLAALSEDPAASENVPGWRSADTLTSPASPESEENPANAINGRFSRKPKWIAKIGSIVKKKNRTAPTSQATLAGASQAQIDIPAAAETNHIKPFWKRRVQVKPLIKKLLHRPHNNHGTTTTQEQPTVNQTEAPPAERAEATPSRSIDDLAIDIDVCDQNSEVNPDRASFRGTLPSDLRSNGKPVDEIRYQETGVLNASRGSLSSNLSFVGEVAVESCKQEAEAVKNLHDALHSDLSEPVDDSREQDTEAVKILHRALPSDPSKPVDILHRTLPSDLREPVDILKRTLPSDLTEPVGEIYNQDSGVLNASRGTLPSTLSSIRKVATKQETEALDASHRTLPSDSSEPVDDIRNQETGGLNASRGTLSSSLSSIGEAVAKQQTEALDASYRTLHSDLSESVGEIRNQETEVHDAFRNTAPSDLLSIGNFNDEICDQTTEELYALRDAVPSDLLSIGDSVHETRDQPTEELHAFRNIVPSNILSLNSAKDIHNQRTEDFITFRGNVPSDLSSIGNSLDETRDQHAELVYASGTTRPSDLRSIDAGDFSHHETASDQGALSSDLSSIEESETDEDRYLETAPHHDASSSDRRFVDETAESGRHHEPSYYGDVPYRLGSIDEEDEDEDINYQFDMRRHGVAPVDHHEFDMRRHGTAPVNSHFSSGLRLPLDEISEEEMEQMASVSDETTFLQPFDQRPQERSQISSEGASVLDMILPAIEQESHLAVVTEQDVKPTDLVQATQVKLADKYDFLHPLGAGGQSQVVLARHKATGQLRVVKCFTSASVWDWHTTADGTKVPMEVALMQSMQDVPSCPPTILRMHEFINVAPQYALVTEYLGEEWVDLFTYMDMAGPLTEETARHIFHQVISATSWLHSRNILHNDLKDENILINQVTLETKLIDFGSANAVTPSSRQFSGTRKFMSPQVLDCLENQGADWSPTDQELWSLGTLLFILLFGTDPFSDEYEAYQVDIQVKLSCIMARQSRQVSAKAAKLVEGLLERDHRRRWSLAMALGAEFWDDNQ
ncbi:hypothetical protein HDU88_008169 [Geranomyces variabilis]|nr:hypothetical protein HDU88_008169 [Geranomyces variabilis]